MSIATEISRLQGAKADIKTAIEAKGVSVPSSAKLDVYDTYIAQISGGGGGGGFTRGYASVVCDDRDYLEFTGITEAPAAFIVTLDLSGDSSDTGIIAVIGDSTGTHAVYSADSTHQHNYTTGCTTTIWSGFAIECASSIPFILGATYKIVYYYGDGTLTFKTSQIQPGSGVTAVTFTGTDLTEVPAMYACFLETQVNNESYRRVAYYTNESGGASATAKGVSFFSSQIHDTTSSFSVSYNNGLYINSGGTNAGGYFHNPGTYTLYYLMASDVEGGGGGINLQAKSATPSTSQQVIQADEGYDGLEKVTISAIQTQTKSATPTTSAQNITPDAGKYLTQVSVAAVTSAIDSNIQAGNIKSGVTILGVAGTYSGGGGGAVLTPTAGDYPVVGNGGLGGGGSALTSTGISVTIPVTGTYRLKWCAFRRNNSTSYTWSSRLYRTRSGQTSAIGTENSTWTSTYIQTNSQDIACNAGDVITVYVRGRSSSYSWGGMLTACVAQKLWTN